MNKLLLACVLFACLYSCASEENGLLFPSESDVESAWLRSTKDSRHGLQQFYKIVRLASDCKTHADTNDVLNVRERILIKLFSTSVADVNDVDLTTIDIFGKSLCLMEVLKWPTIYAGTNHLMRIADDISRYKLLPELNSPKVLGLASRLDDIIEYGTNCQHRSFGTGPRYGRIGQMILHLSEERINYNRQVKTMRRRILKKLYQEYVRQSGSDAQNGEKIDVLQEFARRAKLNDEEQETCFGSASRQ